MLDRRIGKTRITFSTRARWTNYGPDGAARWTRKGIVLALTHYGFWGPGGTFVLRIPLTPKVAS